MTGWCFTSLIFLAYPPRLPQRRPLPRPYPPRQCRPTPVSTPISAAGITLNYKPASVETDEEDPDRPAARGEAGRRRTASAYTSDTVSAQYEELAFSMVARAKDAHPKQ